MVSQRLLPTETSDIVLISVAEAAKLLRISRRQYYYLAARGLVPKPARICGKSSVPKHEIMALIEQALAEREK